MSNYNRSTAPRPLAFIALVITVFGATHRAEATIRYVNGASTGANDGTSWTNAFTSLQSALDAAVAGDQIWVAEGTYKPTKRELPADPRSVTFKLKSSVALYGGFAGTESSLAQRQLGQHITTLNGDLAGNDGPNFENDDENSYHVVMADGTDASTLLDRFTITAGNANGKYPGYHTWTSGGGIHIGAEFVPGHVMVRDCVLYRNRAFFGGGIYNLEGNPTLIRCLFLQNTASTLGGGVGCCDDTSAAPLVLNCRFFGNSAQRGGGWDSGENASALLMNCLFSGNVASTGGGFSGCCGQYTIAANCTFSRNHATFSAGGSEDLFRGRNCVFWENSDPSGQTEQAQIGTHPWLEMSYCCIQNLETKFNQPNFDANPSFMDPDGPDNLIGTVDDDLRLMPGSPCIDAGFNAGFCRRTPQSQYGFFGNSCDFASDLVGNDRYADDPATPDCPAPAIDCGTLPIIDIGAYEYAPAPIPTRLLGDLNCDGAVNPADAPAFAIAVTGRDAYYAAYPNCHRSNADTNDDGIVDGRDVTSFAALLLIP